MSVFVSDTVNSFVENEVLGCDARMQKIEESVASPCLFADATTRLSALLHRTKCVVYNRVRNVVYQAFPRESQRTLKVNPQTHGHNGAPLGEGIGGFLTTTVGNLFLNLGEEV